MLTRLMPSFVFVGVLAISIVATRILFRILELRPPEERRIQRWGRSGTGAVMSNTSIALFAGFFVLFLLTAALNALGIRAGGPEAPWLLGVWLLIVISFGFRDSLREKRKKNA